MAEDKTVEARRALVERINATPGNRGELEAKYGRVWTLEELLEEFEVETFLAPFVVVRRKADGKRGAVSFQHDPRFYFEFQSEA
jgi:hypothetical protein